MSEQFVGTMPCRSGIASMPQPSNPICATASKAVGPLAVSSSKAASPIPPIAERRGRHYVMRTSPARGEAAALGARGRSGIPRHLCTRRAGIPVPPPTACARTRAYRRAFFVMECVEGACSGPVAAGLEPSGRAAIYDEMNRVIAALHQSIRRHRPFDYGKRATIRAPDRR